MEYREQNNYPKAFACTAVIMAALFAFCYLLTFSNPPRPEDGTGGILVNYGTTDEGMGNDYMSVEEASKAEKASKDRPDKLNTDAAEKTNAESSDKKVVSQNTEDAPVITANDKKPSNTVTTETQKAAAKPTINQAALYKGKANNATGEGDGTTNTPGNQGKTTGTTLTNNYNGTGSGNGGNLVGMPQRNFVSRPVVDDVNHHTGKICVDIQVDKQGTVISAHAGARGTTITDYALFERCEKAVLNSKLNALETAEDVQQGTVVFVFKVN